MQLFESRELEAYLRNLVKIDKFIRDYIGFDSEVERNFAEKLDRMDNVKLFVKLPGWFRIATPVGSYNPDWAIVLECDEKLYLVRETKGATDTAQLRWSELARIKCGKAHFDELGVDYKHISAALDKPLEHKISIPVPHKGITSNLISPLKTRSQSGIKARVLQLNPHFVQ